MSDHGNGHSKGLAVTSLAALGVVFGDIGTSPLYAFREAFGVANLEPTEEGVLGVLSLIFWALVLIVSIKYLIFVMRADNDGEGGILALTSLIMGDGAKTNRRALLIGIGLFGTALLYGDGMITPAISVLSAVEGLEVTFSGIGPWVVVIASVILVVLFANQHRGTAVLGAMFGPIMVVWFGVLALLGTVQIIKEPGVLAAINPLVALRLVTEEPRFAFLALGGVFLVATGSEALYADMGHFGTKPIRLAWFGLVFPALVINYFGQGALLLNNPEAIENPFYSMAPGWAVLPLVILATMATVIASQALISGVYSLTSQAIQLGYLPRQRIDHTSAHHQGQIYVSAINWVLMIAAVGLVVTFQTSSALAAAYGVGVATDMVITAILIAIVMKERWNWTTPVVTLVIGSFLVVDLTFFGANITKVPAGGWFPLVIGVVGFVIMATWKRGRELITARLRNAEFPVERFIQSIVESEQQRVSGTGVYLHSQSGSTPPSLITNLRHHEVLHEKIVLVSIEISRHPRVPQARRSTVHDLGEGFYQVELLYGFMQQPDVPFDLRNIVSSGFGFSERRATYFLGKETILATDLPGMAIWRERLFSVMHRNSSSAASFFNLPHDHVVEVGIQVAI